MKKIIRTLLIASIAFVMFACVPMTTFAAENYTYNYDYWWDIQYSPNTYDVVGVYTASDLNLEVPIKLPQGLTVHNDMIYICDTGNNRILELIRKDSDTIRVKRIIDGFYGKESVRTFSGPTDICVTDDGYMYICDKGNGRVLKLDMELNYIMSFTQPVDATYNQDWDFLPNKVVVDDAGRVFCIADNVNKGLIKYEADGKFMGYIGASEVTYDVFDFLKKKFATKAQRDQMEDFVPTEYDNIYMDKEGFIYACTTHVTEAKVDSGEAKPVRKLNMLGKNILVENANYTVIGDIQWDDAAGYAGCSLIADITALDNDIYFCIDKVRGHIFAYDDQGRILYAFGGNGNMDGYFKLPIGIEHMGNDIIVLDSLDASITLFTPTEFGNLIYKAIDEYDQGKYIESGETWMKVLQYNGNYDQAYLGVGRALFRQGKYKEAMDYFKVKYERKNYSKAFKYYRKEWVEDHIFWILGILGVLIVIPLVIGKIKKIRHEIDIADIFIINR